MRIDLQRPDSWDNVSQAYREALKLGDSRVQAQAYMGVRHGVWEICMQLAQLFPNKRTVAYLKDALPVFENVALALSREGFTVKPLSMIELRDPSPWVEMIHKDLLFILYAADDPVTGELFEFPNLEPALKDKRVYRVEISHAKHTCVPLTQPMALESKVLSIRADRAVAVLGERVKILPPVASGMNWPSLSVSEAQAELATVDPTLYETMRSRVEAFERSLPKGAERIVPVGQARLYDRTLFAFRDVDGLALITELAKELSLNIHGPGEKGPLETASLCRWQDERALAGLVHRGFAPEILRGLVILAAETLTDDLKTKIETAHARLLRLQNGDS